MNWWDTQKKGLASSFTTGYDDEFDYADDKFAGLTETYDYSGGDMMPKNTSWNFDFSGFKLPDFNMEWLDKTFGTTDAKGNKTGGALGLAQALGTIGGLYTGMKAADLQEETFKHNVMDAQRTYDMAKDAYDRQVARGKSISEQMSPRKVI